MHPNEYNRYRKMTLAPADMPGSGGMQQQQQQQQQEKKPGDENDDGKVSFDLSGDFWESKDGKGSGKTTEQIQAERDQAKTENEMFDAHISGLNFGKLDISPEDFQKMLQDGNLEPMEKAMTKMMQDGYRKVLMDASRLVNNSAAKTLDAAKQQIQTVNSATDTIKALETALPFTSKKAVAPVAQSIMKKAISDGMTTEKAIETVRQFFAETMKIGKDELGLKNTGAFPGNGGYGENTDNVPKDWTKFLTS